jgi:hypothetical protein
MPIQSWLKGKKKKKKKNTGVGHDVGKSKLAHHGALAYYYHQTLWHIFLNSSHILSDDLNITKHFGRSFSILLHFEWWFKTL